MTDYDYANARLRATALPANAGRNPGRPGHPVPDVTALLNALTRTPYREAVELALVNQTGLAALREALQSGISMPVLRRAGRFFPRRRG